MRALQPMLSPVDDSGVCREAIAAAAVLAKSPYLLRSCIAGLAAAVLLLLLVVTVKAAEGQHTLAWPEIGRDTRPWAYWWWMGSGVDKTNISRELHRYRDAGMGGVHIIPIYGAKGFESKFIDYLSPAWMEMLDFTVSEAAKLGLGVDMTTGSGWCFGGPHVSDEEANTAVQLRTVDISAGNRLSDKIDRKLVQAVVACASTGRSEDLTSKVAPDGSLDWSPPSGTWRVYIVSQKPSGQKVKRAAPGGQGHMLNLVYPVALSNYLGWFDRAFSEYSGAKPRAMYHDSYEYRSDWAPNFFEAFERRRGYRLQSELPALFYRPNQTNTICTVDAEHAARVKCDYRATVAEIMAEESLPLWSEWSRRNGFLTRNEAHGSPGNWLDLYATADIPETEMFHTDRNKLISKFASSAAHVTGRNLVGCETGTWLNEHFTETLAEMKYLLDDLFLSGVNHILYHGTCYSPDEADWPGWLFYASYQMNPRNSIWRDVPALNGYAARCQAVLQSGRPDHDILLYWPIHDLWHNPDGMVRNLTVHARDWFEEQPIGRAAEALWKRGYGFDYVSDLQLATATAGKNGIEMRGGRYQAILVPETQLIPVETLEKLQVLAKAGATVLFQNKVPTDVPGWGRLEEKRAKFREISRQLPGPADGAEVATLKVGRGRILVGGLEPMLAEARVPRETLFDQAGLMCIRRAVQEGHQYFIANRSDTASWKGWLSLGRPAKEIVLMDPMTGRTGYGAMRKRGERPEVYVELEPGESLILRCLQKSRSRTPAWRYWEGQGTATALTGNWSVRFLAGGPELPSSYETTEPGSWANRDDLRAQAFAGTACYSLAFDAPSRTQLDQTFWLDLGTVAQSARVRLNGRDLGTLITPPFRVLVDSLKPKGNQLDVEVTNVSANRIRDLDRRGVKWKNFYDINFVNINYKPFDASNWPLSPSGLLGPVTLTPVSQQKF